MDTTGTGACSGAAAGIGRPMGCLRGKGIKMDFLVSVTGPTRREACGSMCKLLLLGMVKNTGKVNNWQTGILRARQMSASVNEHGLPLANNIQRA